MWPAGSVLGQKLSSNFWHLSLSALNPRVAIVAGLACARYGISSLWHIHNPTQYSRLGTKCVVRSHLNCCPSLAVFDSCSAVLRDTMWQCLRGYTSITIIAIYGICTVVLISSAFSTIQEEVITTLQSKYRILTVGRILRCTQPDSCGDHWPNRASVASMLRPWGNAYSVHVST